MPGKLEQLDQQLFLFLNSINSPFWDQVMHALTGKLIWVPLYIAILLYIALQYKRKFYIIILFIILGAILADQSSVFMKNLVQRPRPCYEPLLEGLVHIFNNECGGKYGFVSSHASNSFNVAVFSLLFIRKFWFSIFIILWALIVGYTRIYLGVHYPADVFFGSILGIIVGWSVYSLYTLADRKILQHNKYFRKPDLFLT
jgi:undecaprenyl-diphosphatase